MKIRNVLILTIALLALGKLAGCNTVKGVGKDIHDSAQNVQIWLEDSSENKVNVDTRSARR